MNRNVLCFYYFIRNVIVNTKYGKLHVFFFNSIRFDKIKREQNLLNKKNVLWYDHTTFSFAPQQNTH